MKNWNNPSAMNAPAVERVAGEEIENGEQDVDDRHLLCQGSDRQRGREWSPLF
jgi:hypothetical protein